MKRPWAFICAAEGTSSAHLRRYCRTVFECGYVPVCPRLQDGQFVALDDPDERHIYNDIEMCIRDRRDGAECAPKLGGGPRLRADRE